MGCYRRYERGECTFFLSSLGTLSGLSAKRYYCQEQTYDSKESMRGIGLREESNRILEKERISSREKRNKILRQKRISSRESFVEKPP